KSYTLVASGVHAETDKNRVRRLTAVECERVQRFPDDHTRIPWRGKTAEDCPDGLRYKAIGNSMVVPVMRWISRRIQNFIKEQDK
ncbi:DNA cytosine methyltransferase, partial [Neisseria arctica]|uniref:DNA cytosine methyltransferase n=1 Tax=Neisseria arctica TaxID=1470200 RepID=UPI0006498B07